MRIQQDHSYEFAHNPPTALDYDRRDERRFGQWRDRLPKLHIGPYCETCPRFSTGARDAETPRGSVAGSVESLSYGFGFGTVRFKGVIETLLVSSVTPIDGDHVDVRFSFSVKKIGGADITKGVGAAFINEVSRQLEQDIPIWEHKTQWERPVLCDGDGPVGLFRKWSRQFYVQPAAADASE